MSEAVLCPGCGVIEIDWLQRCQVPNRPTQKHGRLTSLAALFSALTQRAKQARPAKPARCAKLASQAKPAKQTRQAWAEAYDDSEPLRQAASKNAELEMIFDDYGNSILRLAFAYLHNMEDAEEVLQDTLIRYMNKAPEFRSEAHRKAWLLTVAANLSKNRIGYNKLRETTELNEELADSLAAGGRDDLSFVWEAVKALPEKYRLPIHLFYQEGYQTAQIAEILGEKESTIRSHLKRGRDKLKEILKEEYDFG